MLRLSSGPHRLKHTSRSLQPTDYRKYSHGTTYQYSLRKITTTGKRTSQKEAGRRANIFPTGNCNVFRSWHTATIKLSFDPAGHRSLHVTKLLPTGMVNSTGIGAINWYGQQHRNRSYRTGGAIKKQERNHINLISAPVSEYRTGVRKKDNNEMIKK